MVWRGSMVERFQKIGAWLSQSLRFNLSGVQSERIFLFFHGAFRVVRAIRVQKLVLSNDNEKTTLSFS